MKNFARRDGPRRDDNSSSRQRSKFGNKFGGGKKFGSGSFDRRPKFGGPRRDDDSREEKQRFHAVCAQCGKDCEVPFRPANGKPVYCHDCFVKQPYVPGRNSNGADGPRPFATHPMHSARPAPMPSPMQMPAYDDGAIRDLRRQFDALEGKVDHIIALLNERPATVAPKKSAPSKTPAKSPAKKAAKTRKKK
jgi:CxxC-x17-CxxC domain-containing protein